MPAPADRPATVGWVICLLALAAISVAVFGCASDPDARVSGSGARATASSGSPAGGEPAPPLTPLPVPTNPADEGVVVAVIPTTTPDPAPPGAAPAILGVPIVIGISELTITSPVTICAGPQTYEVVNTGDSELTFALFGEGEGFLTVTSSSLIVTTELFDQDQSRSLAADLAPGSYVMAVFRPEANTPSHTLRVEVVG